MARIDINKKMLSDNLEGRLDLSGFVRYAYLQKGETGKPELVFIYNEMPGYRNGLQDSFIKKGAPFQNCIKLSEEEYRFVFPKADIVITTVAADDEYVAKHKDLLSQEEAFCLYSN